MPSAVFVPGALSELPGDVLLGSVAQGDILIRGATKWNNLATSPLVGAILLSGGAGANPSWSNAAPPATANRGLVNLGSGPWDGATAGFFVGHASGTLLAGNAATGFAGNLLDLQVAGASKTKITSGGQVLMPFGSNTVPSFAFDGDPDTGFFRFSGTPAATHNGTVTAYLSNSFASFAIAMGLGTNASGPDVYLYRDAANIFAQRNGVNAQILREYLTYTDASNYTRLGVGFQSGVAQIRLEGAGTGNVQTNMAILNATPNGGIDFYTSGTVAFTMGTTSLAANGARNIWNGTAALATTDTAGFLGVNSCAGPPTGVPAGVPTGQIPLVFDSTNLKLYAYVAGAWKASGVFA